MLVVGESAGKHIADYSMQFQSEFVALLSRTCGTQRVKANNIYQDYIRDKNHLHMNATRWVTLSGFVQHLGQAGIVRVEDTEKGLFISWIDNSPKALAKAEANLKKERLNKSDEQRERDLIAEQIERATAMQEEGKGGGSGSSDSPSPPAELIRNEGEKVKLSFSFKKPTAVTTAPTAPPNATEPNSVEGSGIKSEVSLSSAVETPSTSASAIALKPSAPAPTNVFKTNVFKAAAKPVAGNVFKSGSTAKPSAIGSGTTAGVKRPLSVAEALMQEDMERKRRRMDREGLQA